VVDTRLMNDPLLGGAADLHAVNVIATRNLLVACSGADPPVRKRELSETELLGMISSLDGDALQSLRDYEESHQARPRLLQALDHALARRRATSLRSRSPGDS
jgi:hypothetical protein